MVSKISSFTFFLQFFSIDLGVNSLYSASLIYAVGADGERYGGKTFSTLVDFFLEVQELVEDYNNILQASTRVGAFFFLFPFCTCCDVKSRSHCLTDCIQNLIFLYHEGTSEFLLRCLNSYGSTTIPENFFCKCALVLPSSLFIYTQKEYFLCARVGTTSEIMTHF